MVEVEEPYVAIRARRRHPDGVSDTTTPDMRDDTTPDVAEQADVATDTPRKRRRIDKTLLLVSAVIGIGLTLVVRGLLLGVTGDDRADLPPQIERITPVPEATQVLSQSNIFVDLAPGHTGVLIVDGVEIETVNIAEISNDQVEPGQQVRVPSVTVYEPGNATLTFTPSAGAPITELVEGEHEVTVLFWLIDESRQFARTYTWTFSVV